MSEMPDVTLVLEEIIYRFNQRPLPKQELVSIVQELVLHILFQLRDQLDSAFFPQLFKHFTESYPGQQDYTPKNRQ